MVKNLKNIVDIGGGCFQSIALDSSGKLFTFGDNFSGQQGIGNFSRCYSPKLMTLDINGIFAVDTLAITKNKISSEEPGLNTDFIFKIIKYILFLSSIVLNVVLYRKLKSDH